MVYNISKEDFADHVRQVNTWKDLAIRCGCEIDSYGDLKHIHMRVDLQKKASNMKLNVDHFRGQTEFPDDDVFIKMVEECDGFRDIVKKCVSASGKMRNRAYFNRRIKDLCLDTSHWKKTSINTKKKHPSKQMNMIDDEAFKTILNNSINWSDLCRKCGYKAKTVKNGARNGILERIKKLGLDTNHLLDGRVINDDKIFVVESQYTDKNKIKKRLVRDFDRPYECNACKNVNFTKRDGILMWNDQEIVLQLEHKNGINNDNRLENLEFLCPNCHAQTSTFTGRNSKKHKIKQAWVEDGKTENPPGCIASLLN